jgi:acetoin utilization deacetylase AcuC-like enzyme
MPLSLKTSDYNWVTQQLKDITKKYSLGRIVSASEGGYALFALGRSVLAHI